MSNITQGKIINLFHSTVSIYEVISNDYATNSIIFKWKDHFIVNINPINPEFYSG